MDTFLQAFRIAEQLGLPVMVCYDGFILSHTVMPVDVPTQDQVDAFLPALVPRTILDTEDPRNINPVTLANPRMNANNELCHGYMEFRYLLQQAMDTALTTIVDVDKEFEEHFGRSCGGLTWSYAMEDADVALIAAGSLANEATVAADSLRAEGIKTGVLGIRSYRPFPDARVAQELSKVHLAIVFDKSLTYGYGGPIYVDVQAALFRHKITPDVHGYIAGLGGRDVNAQQLSEAAHESLLWTQQNSHPKPINWINLQI